GQSAVPLVYQEVSAVHRTPKDEAPPRSMPHAAQNHGQHQIELSAPLGAAVSPERDIQVVPQASGKRYVPPTPELAYIFGLVRRIEVVGQADIEEPGQANCHVRVSGEVEVKL